MNIPIEQLLYESEGATLDFKRKQYKFKGVTDPEKVDLLNDILAFANTWRREIAYILIGVEQNLGGRGIIHHIDDADHIDDATLQQFVNEKTNRPIDFSYKVIAVDGKKIGVIEIPVQKRPFFLKSQFGRLVPNIVYIRRGGPLGKADPDEIFRMGVSYIQEEIAPSIAIEFVSPDKESLGKSIHLVKEIQDVEGGIPDYDEPPSQVEYSVLLGSINRFYYEQYNDYFTFLSIFQPIRIAVVNTGATLISNARLFAEIPEDISIRLNPVRRPHARKSNPLIHTPIEEPEEDCTIRLSYEGENQKILEIDLGNIQPKAKGFSSIFYITGYTSISKMIHVQLYADNLPNPEQVTLHLITDITRKTIQVNDLMRIIHEDHKLLIQELNKKYGEE